MKKIIHFSRAFVPAVIVSVVLIVAGLVNYIVKGGFSLGVDFQAGFIQEVQIAPSAFAIGYSGKGDATANFSKSGISIVVSGADVEGATYTFLFSQYRTLSEITKAMLETVDGLSVDLRADPSLRCEYFLQSAQGTPELGVEPFIVHYLEPEAAPIKIEEMREALYSIDVASIQILGNANERRFLIRIDAENTSSSDGETAAPDVEILDEYEETAFADGVLAEKPAEDSGGEVSTITEEANKEAVASEDEVVADMSSVEIVEASLNETVMTLLEEAFGKDGIAIIRSDFVGSRFSKQLTSQTGVLLALTLLLILFYSSFRFKPQFAIGAVLAIIHDALIMTAFISWTGMEFNTTTIAAILTILGYSINDTIVIFDRVRETRLLYQEISFKNLLDRAISETLGRTIITTLTTMFAVLSLYIFTTQALYQDSIGFSDKLRFIFSEHNNMKDFALALLVGMTSGVYSTIFIACGWTLFWDKYIRPLKKEKEKAEAAV
ncbi:MAG: protein translocase subunit SecF [Spirochaetaceae bacterium]|jgi:preprotein translocase subunit SecF|nr:protein translocase subunit SecF [Spirochaetaceae bacterium]